MQPAARRAEPAAPAPAGAGVSRERLLEMVGEEFGPAAEGFLSETPPHDPRPRPTPDAPAELETDEEVRARRVAKAIAAGRTQVEAETISDHHAGLDAYYQAQEDAEPGQGAQPTRRNFTTYPLDIPTVARPLFESLHLFDSITSGHSGGDPQAVFEECLVRLEILAAQVPGQGGEGAERARRLRMWAEGMKAGCAQAMVEAADYLSAPPADAALREALEWFVGQQDSIQSRFELDGPKDMVIAMRAAFAAARAALSADAGK